MELENPNNVIPAPEKPIPVIPQSTFKSPLPEHLDYVDPAIANVNVGAFAFPTNIATGYIDLSLGTVQHIALHASTLLSQIEDAANTAFGSSLTRFEEINDEGLDDGMKKRLRQNAERDANKLFKEVRDREEKKFAAQLEKAEADLELEECTINGTLSMCPSPAGLLEILSIQSPADMSERNRWDGILAHAGYHALLTRAMQALSQNNLQLGSAVAARLEALKATGQRVPLPPGELARRLCGDQHRKLLLLQTEIRNMRRNLAVRRREVLLGKPRSGYDIISKKLREIELAKQREAAGKD